MGVTPVKVISHAIPRHRCDLPGFWERRRLTVRVGTVVECLMCHQQWEWGYGYEEGKCWRKK